MPKFYGLENWTFLVSQVQNLSGGIEKVQFLYGQLKAGLISGHSSWIQAQKNKFTSSLNKPIDNWA